MTFLCPLFFLSGPLSPSPSPDPLCNFPSKTANPLECRARPIIIADEYVCPQHLLKKPHAPKVESGKGRSGVVPDWHTEPHTKYTVEPDGGTLLVIADLLLCVCACVRVGVSQITQVEG